MIGPLATLFQLAFGVILVGVGMVGMFYAPWELSGFYGVDPKFLGSSDAINVISEFRLLKGLEAGFGFFCLLRRKDIIDGGLDCLIFLIGLGLIIFARSWSWVVDGTPGTLLIVFLVLEIMTFILVWLNTRRGRP